MKLGARQLANIAVGAVVSVVALTWAVLGLAHIDPFAHPATIRVRLAQTGGALPGTVVDYLGVPVGQVTKASIQPNDVQLTLTVTPKGPMADRLKAQIRDQSALGQPYVDLSPATPGLPAANPNGQVIPVSRTSETPPLSTLLQNLGTLLSAINPPALRSVVDGFSGLIGEGGTINQLFANAAIVSQVLGRNATVTSQLIDDAARLTAALDAQRQNLGSAIDGAAQLSTVLAQRTAQLQGILTSGAAFGASGTAVVQGIQGTIGQVLSGVNVTFGSLAARPGKLSEIVNLTPLMVSQFAKTFQGNYFWLSAGGGIPFVPGGLINLGVPVYGKGIPLQTILLPNLAKKITVDLGGKQPAAAYQLLSPQQAAEAASSPAGYAAVQKQAAAGLLGPG